MAKRWSMIALGALVTGCAASHCPAGTHDDAGPVVIVPGPSNRDAGIVEPSDAGGTRADAGPIGTRADAGPIGPTDGGPAPTTPAVVSGEGELLDVYVVDAGWILVLRDHVRLVARDGLELARWEAPREITTAAFDGTYVGVADRAALTALDAETLEEASSVLLTEECESAVVVGGHRFVCGPENDWDRVFYTYDLETGTELARSAEHTYNGIPMRRVPGRDAFVTVTVGSSPSDFHLYSVTESGRAEFVNESPYHGDFAATDVYAFHGMPATHLVTHEGLMLRSDECEPGFSSEATCFYRDGMLGTLSGTSAYLGMDSGSDGFLYGLAGERPVFSDDVACEGGCEIQRVEVEARRVAARARFDAPFRGLVALRRDPFASGVVVATHATCEWDARCRGWSVRAVELE
jgi:hypothetical protein